MNPYMTAFVFLGAIYLGLLVWGILLSFKITIWISLGGIAFCSWGWKFSRDHLQ